MTNNEIPSQKKGEKVIEEESGSAAMSRFHGIHPLKRFKLLQQENMMEPHRQYCLPAKKRIWALQPLRTPNRSPSPSIREEDDYHPSPQKPRHKKKVRFATAEEEKQTKEEEEEGKKELEEDGIFCNICRSTDGNPSDPIVFCDGCDLMVHATCYGNPLVQAIPDGDWFCSRCQGGDDNDGDKSCCLCPVREGAIKPTTDGRWAHILCALLVPEVFFKNPQGREGIDCSSVPRRRWKGICYICNSNGGSAIECSEPKCGYAFHVSCGLQEDICLEYREGRTGGIVVGFCKTHTLTWKKQQQTGKYKIVPRENTPEQGKRSRSS